MNTVVHFKPQKTKQSGYWEQRQAWEKQIRADKKLRAAAKVVLLAIAAHLNTKKFTAWPSIRTLAAECGMARKGVQRGIKNGESRGHMDVRRARKANGSQASNLYVPRLWCGVPEAMTPGWRRGDAGVAHTGGPDSTKDSTNDSKIQLLRAGVLLSQPTIPSEESQEKERSLPRKEAKEGLLLGQPSSFRSTPQGGGLTPPPWGVDSGRAAGGGAPFRGVARPGPVGGCGGAVGGGAAEALSRAAAVEGGPDAIDEILSRGEGQHIGGLKRIIEDRGKAYVTGRKGYLDVPGLLSSGAVYREGQIVFPVGCERTEGRGFYMPDTGDEEQDFGQS